VAQNIWTIDLSYEITTCNFLVEQEKHFRRKMISLANNISQCDLALLLIVCYLKKKTHGLTNITILTFKWFLT
jgi:hypothetical protein